MGCRSPSGTLLPMRIFLPNLNRLSPHNAIIDRLHEMAAEAKHSLGESIQRQKPLSLNRGGKPTYVTFTLASRLVRHVWSVFPINVIEVFHGRHPCTLSDIIASMFIGHQSAGLLAVAFENAAEETFGRALIAATLHQNINDVAVLIHGAPEIVACSLNGDQHFVDVPRIP